jgi:hypothetical protein
MKRKHFLPERNLPINLRFSRQHWKSRSNSKANPPELFHYARMSSDLIISSEKRYSWWQHLWHVCSLASVCVSRLQPSAPQRWRQHVLMKSWYLSIKLRFVISRKISNLYTALRTSNVTCVDLYSLTGMYRTVPLYEWWLQCLSTDVPLHESTCDVIFWIEFVLYTFKTSLNSVLISMISYSRLFFRFVSVVSLWNYNCHYEEYCLLGYNAV